MEQTIKKMYEAVKESPKYSEAWRVKAFNVLSKAEKIAMPKDKSAFDLLVIAKKITGQVKGIDKLSAVSLCDNWGIRYNSGNPVEGKGAYGKGIKEVSFTMNKYFTIDRKTEYFKKQLRKAEFIQDTKNIIRYQKTLNLLRQAEPKKNLW